jgi:hypothetical protein
MEEITQSNQEAKAYKFKELKVYASTEWLADNKKKYRQVYDRLEASYVYAELSFFNKHFDVKSWDVEVTLRCLSMKRAGKELCRLQIKILLYRRKRYKHQWTAKISFTSIPSPV